ncbi:MAG: phenylacetate-CoA oxygenase subunit PaaJ [Micrococcales bacterium]|nr:MAG: phenylacetate-CoA oxygenase subunit PaaJ [Micrococcales bacterium]
MSTPSAADTAPRRPQDPAAAAAWDVAATVCDPEVPVVTIEDLGILRSVSVTEEGVIVEITPTYSGCPAMGTIRDDVTQALEDAGYSQVQVRMVLSPAWTTDWMSEAGKQKLMEYGISPPSGRAAVGTRPGPTPVKLSVRCPQCGSLETREMARFGSTACKALYVCQECMEPFDYFKVL